ncbi:uncharacterized protein LOC106011071 [Aplysia californica]|uniref:Uncharacterized protein LOC106011071 n=1 Tax=Aplysia californica TaxID=6500 RepID=A0ABM0ZUR3_APLCA|nr:uncharacterized protein LOC106011071 [Aplysia californica]
MPETSQNMFHPSLYPGKVVNNIVNKQVIIYAILMITTANGQMNDFYRDLQSLFSSSVLDFTTPEPKIFKDPYSFKTSEQQHNLFDGKNGKGLGSSKPTSSSGSETGPSFMDVNSWSSIPTEFFGSAPDAPESRHNAIHQVSSFLGGTHNYTDTNNNGEISVPEPQNEELAPADGQGAGEVFLPLADHSPGSTFVDNPHVLYDWSAPPVSKDTFQYPDEPQPPVQLFSNGESMAKAILEGKVQRWSWNYSMTTFGGEMGDQGVGEKYYGSMTCCQRLPYICGVDGMCVLDKAQCQEFCVCALNPTAPHCLKTIPRIVRTMRMLERKILAKIAKRLNISYTTIALPLPEIFSTTTPARPTTVRPVPQSITIPPPKRRKPARNLSRVASRPSVARTQFWSLFKHATARPSTTTAPADTTEHTTEPIPTAEVPVPVTTDTTVGENSWGEQTAGDLQKKNPHQASVSASTITTETIKQPLVFTRTSKAKTTVLPTTSRTPESTSSSSENTFISSTDSSHRFSPSTTAKTTDRSSTETTISPSTASLKRTRRIGSTNATNPTVQTTTSVNPKTTSATRLLSTNTVQPRILLSTTITNTRRDRQDMTGSTSTQFALNSETFVPSTSPTDIPGKDTSTTVLPTSLASTTEATALTSNSTPQNVARTTALPFTFSNRNRAASTSPNLVDQGKEMELFSWFSSNNLFSTLDAPTAPSTSPGDNTTAATRRDEYYPPCADDCQEQGGTCVLGDDFKPQCVKVNQDACDHFRCFNGDCVSTDGLYSCECHQNWTGIFCDEPCSVDCGQHGYCGRVDENNTIGCICHWNYTGPFCKEEKQVVTIRTGMWEYSSSVLRVLLSLD